MTASLPLLAGAGLTAEALRKGHDPGYSRRARTPSGSLPACGTPPPRSAGSPTTCNPLRWTTAGSRQRWRTTLPRSTHPRCRQIRLRAEIARIVADGS